MGRIKDCENFKQASKPWGIIKYPKAPDYVSDSGCGATACADLIVTNPKHKDKTPSDTAKWMVSHGYAIPGQGTAWAGITACLKHYGFKVTQHDDMASFWKEMGKPGRMAIISFRGGTKGGITWTLGGHFLACAGMEIKSGKHRLYMLDPGPRNHDGWFIYEAHMRGLIAQLWTCYLPKDTAEKKVETVVKKKSMDELVKYAKKRALEKHKYKNSGKHSWSTTVNCTWFVGHVYKDCGYTDIAQRVLKSKYWRTPWGKEFLGPWLKVKAAAGKELKESQLKSGDIVIKKTKTANVHHSGIYVGDGKVAEAVGSGTRLGPLKGRHYIMAFRIPDGAPKPEPKTAEHVAQYEVTAKEGRNIRTKPGGGKLIIKIPKGKKFRAQKKKGNWVYGYAHIYGWINIRSGGKDHAKKIK